MRIGIIGAGRWGTALTILLSKAHDVTLYCRSSEKDQLKSRRSEYLPKFVIPDVVEITDIPDRSNEILILAVPGEFLAQTWSVWESQIFSDTIVINVAKMIDGRDHQLILPTSIVDTHNFVHFVAAGFPEGILANSPTMGTAFSKDPHPRQIVSELFNGTPIRVYPSYDVMGGQIGSAMKNVIAIASGIAAGCGFDEMTRATLVSRGALEIQRFAFHHMAKPETFGQGSTFLADLVGTCFSENSRNCSFGKLVVKFNIHALERINGIVEGAHTLRALPKIVNDFFEKMPISAATWQVVFNKQNPKNMVELLMSRPIKDES